MELDSPKMIEEPAESAPAAEHIKAARAHLRSGQQKKAYSLLQKASARYPNHPIIISYCGWLQSAVEKKHQSGVVVCRKALVQFKTDDQELAAAVYPLLYLNLGRALCLAGKKKDAFDNFSKGLRYDKGHYELKKEIKALGIRKAPPISFLSRSNPLNKYLGKMMHKKDKR